jgi:hypothetical protein
MAASEAAVAAVIEQLGCVEYQPPKCAEGCDWCDEPHCVTHSDLGWTDRGCPVAVAAADAAVGQDAPTIAAEGGDELTALRALQHFVWNHLETLDYGDHQGMSREDDQRLTDLAGAAEEARLRGRADRIEGL